MTGSTRPVVFIDGEAGTTGLQIRRRLDGRDDIEVLGIDPELRKDAVERARLLNAADVAILCLPDEAARQAVDLIERPGTRVLDASTAHRVAPGWVYGFPEMTPDQPGLIAGAARAAVPGCYATSTVALLRPLVDAGLVAPDQPVSVAGVQGYSGGGRALVDAMEGRGGQHPLAGPYRAYGLGLAHKHLPEMRVHARLARPPLFTPSVGSWRQGQLVSVPLPAGSLPPGVTASHVHRVLAERYAGQRFVTVVPFEEGGPAQAVLAPEALAGTNRLELHVFTDPVVGHVLLVARSDNLGKGASGAAVQVLDLMLGLADPDRDYALDPGVAVAA